MNNIVFGLFDPEWDGGDAATRQSRWRPTVSVLGHPDFPVARFVLLVQSPFLDQARLAIEDMRALSPLTEIDVRVNTFQDGWDFEEVYAYLHDVMADYPFVPEHEAYFAHMSAGTHVMRICLFLLTEARILPGRMLQSYPADTYGQGAEGGWRVIDLDLEKYDRLARRFERRKDDGQWFLKSGIPTRNAAFNRMIEEIERVAIASRHPLLLTGPTGAGKTILATRIYELKRQRHQVEGEFVPVNCATLRGDGAMSVLFGHRKGAFTGAVADRPGLIRRADGGVLFLDEIGELGLEEQAMLLTAIEKGRYYPVGSDQEVASRFQLIAGTNRDLREDIAAGRFREDVYSRINLWHFELPGLKARIEDIEPNLEHELAKFAQREGHQVSFNRDARARYLDFAQAPGSVWPGNFRDLNASVTRMATLARGGRIGVDEVEAEIVRLNRAWSGAQPRNVGLLVGLFEAHAFEDMDLFDRLQLEQVIGVCRECRTLAEAGRKLFAVSRARRGTVNDSDRLRKYLARFGLSWEVIVQQREDT